MLQIGVARVFGVQIELRANHDCRIEAINARLWGCRE